MKENSTRELSEVSRKLIFYNRGRHLQISANNFILVFLYERSLCFFKSLFRITSSIDNVKARSQTGFIK